MTSTYTLRGAPSLSEYFDSQNELFIIELPDEFESAHAGRRSHLPETWTEVIEQKTGLLIEVREIDCGLGCRCAGEVRLVTMEISLSPTLTAKLAAARAEKADRVILRWKDEVTPGWGEGTYSPNEDQIREMLLEVQQ